MRTGKIANGAKYRIDENLSISQFHLSNVRITNITEIYIFLNRRRELCLFQVLLYLVLKNYSVNYLLFF